MTVVLAASMMACESTPSLSPSAAEPSASAAAGQAGSECESIDLRSPTTGVRVDLTGQWAGSGILAGHDEMAWLNQIGDCVYGSVTGGEISRGPGRTIVNLSGRVGADFVIGFEVHIVTQGDQVLFGEQSTMEMLIEWDDGRIRLRENRVPGETAGRCIQAAGDCPAPVIWYRTDNSSP
jgi:hypothetical protein